MLFGYIFMLFSMALGLFYYEQPFNGTGYGNDTQEQARIIATGVQTVASAIEYTAYHNPTAIPSSSTITAGGAQQQPAWLQSAMDTHTNIITTIHIITERNGQSLSYAVYINPADMPSTQQSSVYPTASWIGQLSQYTPNTGVRQGGNIIQTGKPTTMLNVTGTNSNPLPGFTEIPAVTIPEGSVGIARTISVNDMP